MSVLYINKIIPQGHISGIVSGRIAIIQSLFIEENCRNRKYGSMLLLTFLHHAYNANAIHVELDDCSSNYRKPSNIYLKNGFTYTDTDHHMSANIRQTIKRMKRINLL